MIIIKMSFVREEREDFGSSILSIETRREISLEVPPTLSNEDARDSFGVIFAKYGKPIQITVSYLDRSKSEPAGGELSIARKRLFNVVMQMGFKHKHLRPFVAVQSTGFRAELPKDSK